MEEKKPLSFKLFFTAVCTTIGVLAASIVFSVIQADKKLGVFLALAIMIVATLLPLGIYAGLKHKAENPSGNLNKVSLIGNIILYALYLIIIIAIAFSNFK